MNSFFFEGIKNLKIYALRIIMENSLNYIQLQPFPAAINKTVFFSALDQRGLYCALLSEETFVIYLEKLEECE